MYIYRSTKKITFQSSPFDISFTLNGNESKDFLFVLGFSDTKIVTSATLKSFLSRTDKAIILDSSTEALELSNNYYIEDDVIYYNSPTHFGRKKFVIEGDKVFIEISVDDVKKLENTGTIKVVNNALYNYDSRFLIRKNDKDEINVGLDTSSYKPFIVSSTSKSKLDDENIYFKSFDEYPNFNVPQRFKLTVFREGLISIRGENDENFIQFDKMFCDISKLENSYVYIFLKNVNNPNDFISKVTVSV